MSIAISAGLTVLGYFELPSDEVPPEDIWHHPQRLEEWFEAVKQRRKTGMQPIGDEESDMTGNALTRELLGE